MHGVGAAVGPLDDSTLRSFPRIAESPKAHQRSLMVTAGKFGRRRLHICTNTYLSSGGELTTLKMSGAEIT